MPPMPLTDAKIRALKPGLKPIKLFDGRGLYVEGFPNGSKLWRWKYRFAGKEKRLALGAYPDVTLADARKRHHDALRLVEQGIDPSLERQSGLRTSTM